MERTESARADFAEWRRLTAADWYADDPHLTSLLRHHGVSDDGLADFARVCAQQLDPLIRENNRDEHLPLLRRYDGQGNRIEAIDHHPTYPQIGRLAYRSGVMSLYAQRGAETASLARLYLFVQNGEAGHACPMACTAGLIKVLEAAGNPRPDWMSGLLDPDYDRHLRGAQFLTEVQGGSDVGANVVVARDAGDGTARITGEKWFCSVIDADLFLMTARPEGAPPGTGGLKAYVVPRRLADGSTNGFFIRRLKYKLGTRSMASAEVDFVDAWALPVADFRTVMEVVIDTSRLYNAVCSAAMMQRAWRDASGYARTRKAFGQPILTFPTLARIVARIRTEAYAARGMTFALAALGDRIALGGATERERAARRMLVNLNKFWTSLTGTLVARDAIEVLGGNGAIEEFSVLPRMLRDSIVCEAWEGGHNVLCAQVVRDAERLRLHEPMFDWLAELGAPAERLATVRERWERVLGTPSSAAYARDLCEELRPVAQAAALLAEARGPGSDPLLPVAAAHLLATSARGWDPLADAGLEARIEALA
jgi:acyl-CoA dehydrogenase